MNPGPARVCARTRTSGSNRRRVTVVVATVRPSLPSASAILSRSGARNVARSGSPRKRGGRTDARSGVASPCRKGRRLVHVVPFALVIVRVRVADRADRPPERAKARRRVRRAGRPSCARHPSRRIRRGTRPPRGGRAGETLFGDYRPDSTDAARGFSDRNGDDDRGTRLRLRLGVDDACSAEGARAGAARADGRSTDAGADARTSAELILSCTHRQRRDRRRRALRRQLRIRRTWRSSRSCSESRSTRASRGS